MRTKKMQRGWEDKRKRLLLAREHAGYRSARQAALTMGWVYPTYASHENGLRDFPQKVAERYARAFRVSPEFIILGTNPPDWYLAQGAELMVELESPTRSLRLFKADEAEQLRDWIKHPKGMGGPQYFVTDPGNLSPKSFAVRLALEEMRAKPPVSGEREMLPGDIAIVDCERKDARPGEIVAILVDGDPCIHIRKAVMSSGKLIYTALNRDHGEYQTAEVVGLVKWLMAGI